MDYTIYHNNRCRKSREALQYLTENNIPHKIVHYLETPLNAEELKEILNALGHSADQLLRKQETIWKSEYKHRTLDEDALIQAMVDHPKLIERPIVSSGKKAVVARPIEKLHQFLK